MFIHYLFIIVYIFSSFKVAAEVLEQKPVLRIATSVSSGYTNHDSTGLYWKIVEEVFKEHYQIKNNNTMGASHRACF